MARREQLRPLGDLERWTNRASQGVALPRDLVGMREVLRRVPELQTKQGESANLLPVLPLCSEVLDLLARAIAEEPPATLANPGIIRPGYARELDELIRDIELAKALGDLGGHAVNPSFDAARRSIMARTTSSHGGSGGRRFRGTRASRARPVSAPRARRAGP